MNDLPQQRVKRRRAVDAILRIDGAAVSSEDLRLSVLLAAAPDPDDDTISKRAWEADVQNWRRMVRAAKTPSPESVPLPWKLLKGATARGLSLMVFGELVV